MCVAVSFVKGCDLAPKPSGLSSPQGRNTLFGRKVATVSKAGVSGTDREPAYAVNESNREGCLSCQDGNELNISAREIIVSAIIMITLYIGCVRINLLIDFSVLFIAVSASTFLGFIAGRLSK